MIEVEASAKVPYRQFVADSNWTKDPRDQMALFAMGLMGEAGEVGELFKKHLYHGKDLDPAKVVEELGDLLWYMTSIMNLLDVDLPFVAQQNVIKLEARYGVRS